MTCGVCLKNKADSINVFSEQGVRLEICAVIKEHFWFEPVAEDPVFSQICQICWEQLASFHVFYSTVKQAHQSILERCQSDREPSKSSVFYLPVEEEEGDESISNTNSSVLNSTPKESEDEVVDCKDFLKLIDGGQVICKQEKDVDFEKSVCREDKEEEGPEERFLELCGFAKSDANETVLRKVSGISIYAEAADVSDLTGDNIEISPPATRFKTDAKIQEEDELIAKYINLDCEICSAGFAKFLDLSKHCQKEHQMNGFVRCCDKKLFSRTYILDHINKHLNPARYECKKCNKTFGSQYSTRNHMLMKHAPGREKVYECKECLKIFPDQLSLGEHSYIHLSEENKALYCWDCRKIFGSPTAINMHRNVYHKKVMGHICHVCGAVIPGKAVFLKHLNDHAHQIGDDAVNEPFCSICGKLSASIKALRHHIRYVHSSERPHKCCVCGKSFKLRQKLREHISSHNVGVSLPCPYCHKRFRSKFHLYSHKYRMHKQEYSEERMKRTQNFDCAYETYDVPLLLGNQPRVYDGGNILSKSFILNGSDADYYQLA